MQTEDLKGSKPWWPGALVIGINILLLAAYNICIYNMEEKGLAMAILYSFFITIQMGLCLFISAFVFKKEFIISAILVLLIGFSTCVKGI